MPSVTVAQASEINPVASPPTETDLLDLQARLEESKRNIPNMLAPTIFELSYDRDDTKSSRRHLLIIKSVSPHNKVGHGGGKEWHIHRRAG